MNAPTYLQKLARVVNFTVGFRLQHFTLPYDLVSTARTRRLVARHNEITARLQASIKEDYQKEKKAYLEHKAFVQSLPKIKN